MKAKATYLTLMLLGLLMTACESNPANQSTDNEAAQAELTSEVVSPEAFEGLMETHPNAQLVDVRTPEEVAQGRIAGAVNYNIMGEGFTEQVKQLDPTQPVLLYCRSGRRSANAARQLAAMGFKQVYDLEGGIIAWQGASMPMEK